MQGGFRGSSLAGGRAMSLPGVPSSPYGTGCDPAPFPSASPCGFGSCPGRAVSGTLMQHFGWDNLHTLGKRKQYQRTEKKKITPFYGGTLLCSGKELCLSFQRSSGVSGELVTGALSAVKKQLFPPQNKYRSFLSPR